jgi:pilus assembly protein CpaB
MKSKSFVLMIVSLGFGLVAAIGISQVMGRNHNGQAPEIPKRSVVVAAVDLEHNSLLTEENVRLEEWPLEIIPENTVHSLEQIHEMATRQSLSKGMPLNLGSIVNKKQLNTISIKPGYTVISIKVSADDTIHGLLQPGDKVNIIGHIRGRPAKTFLRGLRVWSVNAEMTAKSTSREEGSASGDAIVGILANERQTELIMQVQKEGSIKLVLRGDHVDVDAEDALDQEGIHGLGLTAPEEESAQARPPATTQSTTPVLPRFQPQPTVTKTMKIWNKDGVETVTFRDGIVATSTPMDRHGSTAPDPKRTPGAALNPSPVSNPDDSAALADQEDRARGLEEDQY